MNTTETMPGSAWQHVRTFNHDAFMLVEPRHLGDWGEFPVFVALDSYDTFVPVFSDDPAGLLHKPRPHIRIQPVGSAVTAGGVCTHTINRLSVQLVAVVKTYNGKRGVIHKNHTIDVQISYRSDDDLQKGEARDQLQEHIRNDVIPRLNAYATELAGMPGAHESLIARYKLADALSVLCDNRYAYENTCREVGVEPIADEDMGGYAMLHGDFGISEEGLAIQVARYRYNHLRKQTGGKAEVPDVPQDMSGQLWEPCEQCGAEPSYMPHHLCRACCAALPA